MRRKKAGKRRVRRGRGRRKRAETTRREKGKKKFLKEVNEEGWGVRANKRWLESKEEERRKRVSRYSFQPCVEPLLAAWGGPLGQAGSV